MLLRLIILKEAKRILNVSELRIVSRHDKAAETKRKGIHHFHAIFHTLQQIIDDTQSVKEEPKTFSDRKLQS